MTMPYVLHYAPDNASLIIRLALEEMGLPYRTALVDRAKEGQRKPDYLRLNPNGLIPVLETPHGPIFETGAILLWLADTHGQMAPGPTHCDRAAFLKWLFFVSNTLHADLRITFYPHRYAGPSKSHHATMRRAVQARLRTHLAHLEALAKEPCRFLGSAAPSVLDYYLAACLRWMALYPADQDRGWFSLADTPHLGTLLLRLETRPAVAAATDAEGLGPTPFTAPHHPQPPEGSAT
ncbi:glutathione S-transferase family protein [Aestuariivita sp.]|jgi:glutathione S-transferase|uniref:glutathione S-transferase family protein n=1 Tax=Aestuariivita sp. TaxID=1872407 RepID=UPI00217456ED|nr:glutathione S-transferase family protein [Aestuariivita sp.]MCE8007937.1 glutathione S-transferase family protein [Aestuariivita sp.]